VRYDVDIYTCANADVSKQVTHFTRKASVAKASRVVNKTNVSAVTIESATVTDEEKPMIKGMTQPGLTPDQTVDAKVLFAEMKNVVPPSPKPLSEARGL